MKEKNKRIGDERYYKLKILIEDCDHPYVENIYLKLNKGELSVIKKVPISSHNKPTLEEITNKNE